MSYVENHLLAGEQVIYRASLHWIYFVTPVFLSLFGIPALIEGGDASPGGLIFLMVGIGWMIARAIGRMQAEFVVTNKRVIMKVGIIRRRSIETLLTKIEGIGVDQSITGRMLGYGSIVVTGTGGSKERFRAIAAPLEFRRQVQQQIEAKEARA